MDRNLLTSDQIRALDLLTSGKNTVILGSAGTGKSVLLSEFGKVCEEKNRNVLFTASTGIAASNFNFGMTIHKALKIHGNSSYDPYTCQPFLEQYDVLIVDEISMINSRLMDNIYSAVSLCKNRIQVVVCGDFYQLPPVQVSRDFPVGYAFESSGWRKLGFEVTLLKTVVRQKDPSFAKCIEDCNHGNVDAINYLNAHINKQFIPNAMTITSTNNLANSYNQEQLDLINAETREYVATGKTGTINWSDSKFSRKLNVKIGEKIMTIVNSPDGQYCNGTIGYIVGFSDTLITVVTTLGKTIDICRHPVEFGTDTDVYQFPIIPAYAITIHKSQGQTLKLLNIDAHAYFSTGMAYVAISRAEEPSQIYSKYLFKPEDFRIDPRVEAFYQSLRAS